MADSVQSRILDAVLILLAATGKPAFRTKLTPWHAGQLPGYNVVPEDSTPEVNGAVTGTTERKFRFAVRHVGAAVDEVDKAIDPLYVAGIKAILADSMLGGLVRWTREGPQKWHFDSEAADIVSLDVQFETEFATTRTDPSVSAY